jgi:hypothetical protein
MRKHFTHISAALLIAAVGVACSKSGVGNDRRAQSGGNRGVNDRIALRGCMQPSTDGIGFTLQHVVVIPSVEQPQGNETMENPLVPRGSSVRLAASGHITDDFRHYLNNEVTIQGDILTAGMVGTSGGSQHDAPSVAVEKVKKIAENCVGT